MLVGESIKKLLFSSESCHVSRRVQGVNDLRESNRERVSSITQIQSRSMDRTTMVFLYRNHPSLSVIRFVWVACGADHNSATV